MYHSDAVSCWVRDMYSAEDVGPVAKLVWVIQWKCAGEAARNGTDVIYSSDHTLATPLAPHQPVLILNKAVDALTQHPTMTSLNIERIDLGEDGARGLAAAVKRGLPLDGVSAYGMLGMMGAFRSSLSLSTVVSMLHMEARHYSISAKPTNTGRVMLMVNPTSWGRQYNNMKQQQQQQQ